MAGGTLDYQDNSSGLNTARIGDNTSSGTLIVTNGTVVTDNNLLVGVSGTAAGKSVVSGLRIGEALPLDWEAIDWKQRVIHVRREKLGINPFVPILDEIESLLRSMRTWTTSHLLFPSPQDSSRPMAYPTAARSLAKMCRDLGIKHVTPQGLRSYFVTRCREAGLTDADIAMLIGDKSGPAIIARTYGDVLPEHLFAQAKRVRLRVRKKI